MQDLWNTRGRREESEDFALFSVQEGGQGNQSVVLQSGLPEEGLEDEA